KEGDLRYYIDVLDRLKERVEDTPILPTILRELAPLRAELGDRIGAMRNFDELSRLDPNDARAMEMLENDANARGDHEMIQELLARRIRATADPETRRTLRFRRVAVLEQRLGYWSDAVAELNTMIAESKDDVSALRYLADIHEKRESPREA